jgi:ferredoxin, 2Fe-2S
VQALIVARIVYIESSGVRHELAVPQGWSVMEGAVRNGVPGIDAECGGACACGTCHVNVDPAKQEAEATMLELGHDVTETSRLSCQIKVTADLDGLVVGIPASQR